MTKPSGSIIGKCLDYPIVSWEEQPLLMMRKQVLNFLQGLFEQQSVGSFQWHESLEESEIVITDESPIKLEVVGKRPALSVVRGTIAWGQTSIDERQEENMLTGQRKHTDLIRGTLSINCCSRVDLESEYLGWIVANHMWILRRLIMKGTPIHEFGRGQQVGSPSPAGAIVQGDTEGEWINTPVTVSFFLQTSSSVKPLSKDGSLIQNIQAKMGIRGGLVQNTPINEGRPWTGGPAPQPPPAGAVIGPPKIRGRVIRDVAFSQELTVKKES